VDLEISQAGDVEHAQHLRQRSEVRVEPSERLAGMLDQPDERTEILRVAIGRAFKLAARVLASIVYQATPRDPFVLAGVVLAMLVLGLLATWIPARRALSIDPPILLRVE
jgi:hypothetical protein